MFSVSISFSMELDATRNKIHFLSTNLPFPNMQQT